jgi:hypothetical protein
MSLFSINSKMKKSANSEYKKIVNFTLPAFKTKDGITVCPQASLCISTCYAKSGAYLFSNVYNKHRSNLDAIYNGLEMGDNTTEEMQTAIDNAFSVIKVVMKG